MPGKNLQNLLDAFPFSCLLWDNNGKLLNCNQEALVFFNLQENFDSKSYLLSKFDSFFSDFQPDGTPSKSVFYHNIKEATKTKNFRFNWLFKLHSDRFILAQIYLVSKVIDNIEYIFCYIKDMFFNAKSISSKIHLSEHRLQTILDSMPFACDLLDLELNCLDVNMATVKMLHAKSKQDFIQNYSKTFPEYQPCGTLSSEKAGAYVQTAINDGICQFEWMHKTLTGLPMLGEVTLVRVEIEGVVRLVAFIRDITEEQRSKQEVLDAIKRLETLLDNAPVACTFWDENLNIIDCNYHALELFNLNSKEEYKDNFFDLSPKLQPDGSNSKEKALELIRLTFKKHKITFEWMHQTLDGKLIPSQITLIILNYKEGVPSRVVGFTIDLSINYEKIDQEKKIVSHMQSIIDSSPTACLIYDKDYKLLDCNKSTLNMLGYEALDSFNSNFFNISAEYQKGGVNSKQRFFEIWTKITQDGEGRYEWLFLSKNKEIIPTDVYSKVLNFGNETYIVDYATDMREYNAIAKLKEDTLYRIKLMVDACPMICFISDENFNIIDCNKEALRISSSQDVTEYGSKFHTLYPIYQPDGRKSIDVINENWQKLFQQGFIKVELMCMTEVAPWLPVEVFGTIVDFDDTKLAVVYMRDLRDAYQLNEIKKVSEERMIAMLDSSPISSLILDNNFNMIICNEAALKLFEVSKKDELILRFEEIFPRFQPDGRGSIEKAGEKIDEAFEKGNIRSEWMFQTLNWELVPCEITLLPIKIDERKVVVMHIQDLRKIRQVVAAAEQLEKLAYTDSLTGAFTRRYFIDIAEKEIKESYEQNHPFCLIMIDIDYFKSINDTRGHIVGDEVLKILVSRIKHTLRKDSIVTRYGGEEFVVMLPKTNLDNAIRSAWRICKNIENSKFLIEDIAINVTASFGVACLTKETKTLKDIIKNADAALYKAKASGKNTVVVYTDQIAHGKNY